MLFAASILAFAVLAAASPPYERALQPRQTVATPTAAATDACPSLVSSFYSARPTYPSQVRSWESSVWATVTDNCTGIEIPSSLASYFSKFYSERSSFTSARSADLSSLSSQCSAYISTLQSSAFASFSSIRSSCRSRYSATHSTASGTDAPLTTSNSPAGSSQPTGGVASGAPAANTSKPSGASRLWVDREGGRLALGLLMLSLFTSLFGCMI